MRQLYYVRNCPAGKRRFVVYLTFICVECLVLKGVYAWIVYNWCFVKFAKLFFEKVVTILIEYELVMKSCEMFFLWFIVLSGLFYYFRNVICKLGKLNSFNAVSVLEFSKALIYTDLIGLVEWIFLLFLLLNIVFMYGITWPISAAIMRLIGAEIAPKFGLGGMKVGQTIWDCSEQIIAFVE